jgi:glycosyltransferase involved in cell wall biosynthesis
VRVGIDVRATQLVHGARGLGAYVYTMLDGLVAAAPGHELVLVALPDRPLPPRLAAHAAAGRCRVAHLRTRVLDGATLVGRLPRLWRLHYLRGEREHHAALAALARRERLDVLHVAVPFESGMFAGVGERLRGRCRVVKTAYDLIPLVFRDVFFPPGSARSWLVYERQLRAYRDADAVVAISASAADDFVRLGGVDPARVRVLPCTVAEHFTPACDGADGADAAAARAQLAALGVASPYFLFCSGAGHNKNRPRIVEAFGRFLAERPAGDRAFQLVFAGPERELDAGALKAVAFDAGLSREQFVMTGFVPDAALVALFQRAVALVTPSLYEGLGLPAAQAMRTGTPVIASDRSAHPELVGDAGLLVDPYDVAAIAAAMARLADDVALRRTLAERGLARSRGFTLAAQARALLAAYKGRPAG